jgi:DNA repair ATPase RecN
MNGQIVRNEPQQSRGGGINDIVAAALQVATMVVYNSPKIQGPIILDEPGKHVSEDFVAKFGEFLAFISKTFNRQINMVTHQPYLAETADRTLYSQLVGGKTQVTESAPQAAAGDDEEIVIVDDEDEIEWDS